MEEKIVLLPKRTIQFIKAPRENLGTQRVREAWVGITLTGYFVEADIIRKKLELEVPPSIPDNMNFYFVETKHALEILEEQAKTSKKIKILFGWFDERISTSPEGETIFNFLFQKTSHPLPYFVFFSDEFKVIDESNETAEFSIETNNFI